MNSEDNKEFILRMQQMELKDPIDQVLQPAKTLKKSFALIDLKNINKENIISLLPDFIKFYIFSRLDHPNQINATLVCKDFYNIIKNDGGKNFKELWDKKFIEKIQNQVNNKTAPEFNKQENKEIYNYLRNMLFSTPNQLWALEKLAPYFSYQPLLANYFNQFTERKVDFFQSALLFNLTTVIKDIPVCHYSLCQAFMNYSFHEDFEKIELASHIVKEIPALQEILFKLIEKTNFNIDDFPNCLKDRRLFSHMKAVKLLALSGENYAKNRVLEFIDYFFKRHQISCDDFISSEKKLPYIFYDSFLDSSKVICRQINTVWSPLVEDGDKNTILALDLDKLFAYYQFASRLSDTKSPSEWKESLQRAVNRFSEYLTEMYEIQNKKIPELKLDKNILNNIKEAKEFIRQSKKYIGHKQYKEAEEILNKALITCKDSLSYPYIMLKLIDTLLYTQNFDNAQDHLKVLLETIGENNVLKTPLFEGDEKTCIYRTDIYSRQAIFHLLQDKLEEFEESLEKALVHESQDRDFQKLNFLLSELTQLPFIKEEFFPIMEKFLNKEDLHHKIGGDRCNMLFLIYPTIMQKM